MMNNSFHLSCSMIIISFNNNRGLVTFAEQLSKVYSVDGGSCIADRWLCCIGWLHDNSYRDISSTTLRLQTFRLQTFRLILYVYQRVGQLYIQLLFHQIIIFINSNFYLHYDSFLSIPLPETL